jgi:hypothetical protein
MLNGPIMVLLSSDLSETTIRLGDFLVSDCTSINDIGEFSRESKSFGVQIRAGSASRVEAIANPGFGEYVFWRRRIAFNLLSQIADEHTKIFILFDIISSPDRSQ